MPQTHQSLLSPPHCNLSFVFDLGCFPYKSFGARAPVESCQLDLPPSGAGRFFCSPPCSRSATSFAMGHRASLPLAVDSISPTGADGFFRPPRGSLCLLPCLFISIPDSVVDDSSCDEVVQLTIRTPFSFSKCVHSQLNFVAIGLAGFRGLFVIIQSDYITSVQSAAYVLADDITDPAPATTFPHLDATTVLPFFVNSPSLVSTHCCAQATRHYTKYAKGAPGLRVASGYHCTNGHGRTV